MADIEGIARKLYNIIISPDTVTGLINGGLSVPLDYGYLISFPLKYYISK